MKINMRNIHRWTGLLALGFIIFYSATGILLDHRQSFDYFTTRLRRESTVPALNSAGILKALTAYEAATGESGPPTVVRLRHDGTVELLYGSHGLITYVFKPGSTRLLRLEKKNMQPLHWLYRLHKAANTSKRWVALADVAAILILIAAVSALFIVKLCRNDWLLLAGGGIFLLIMVVLG
jgi:hypothetical protein